MFLGGTLSDAEPETVPNLPETTAVAGLTWTPAGGWRVNMDLQWIGERFVLNPRFAPVQAMVDGYVLANAKVDLPWRRLGIDLKGALFVAAENLLDEEYEHRLGYPMPGRLVQLGIVVGF